MTLLVKKKGSPIDFLNSGGNIIKVSTRRATTRVV